MVDVRMYMKYIPIYAHTAVASLVAVVHFKGWESYMYVPAAPGGAFLLFQEAPGPCATPLD